MPYVQEVLFTSDPADPEKALEVVAPSLQGPYWLVLRLEREIVDGVLHHWDQFQVVRGGTK